MALSAAQQAKNDAVLAQFSGAKPAPADAKAAIVDRGDNRTNIAQNGQVVSSYGNTSSIAPSSGPKESGNVNYGGLPTFRPGEKTPDVGTINGNSRWNGNAWEALGQQLNNDSNKLIDEAYGQSYSYLDQAEQALRNDLPSALQAAQGNYDLNAQQLGNQRLDANNTLDTQKGKATTSYENALADGRRVFQEQNIGAQQRFGGSSSAGQAFSEIQSREQARQFGQTNRQFTDLTQGIEQQRNSVEREYQTGLLQLTQQKQTAVDQANRDFQNKLLSISQNRAQLGQAKAEARLQALQQLRSEVFAISQQNQQFEQALSMQRQQAQQQLSGFSQFSQGATDQSGQMASNYNPQISSQYGATGGLGQQQATPQMIGSIRPEELQGSIDPMRRQLLA